MKRWRVDDVMTADVVTTYEDTPCREITKLLLGEQVKQHLRRDADIRGDVVQELLHRVLTVEHGMVSVAVRDGVVTLRGMLDHRSAVYTAVRLSSEVPGVVDVVDKLGYESDESMLISRRTGR